MIVTIFARVQWSATTSVEADANQSGTSEYKEGAMKSKFVVQILVGCVVLLASSLPILAGDSFGGKVTEVRSAELVVVDYGTGQYVVRIVGIAVPSEGPTAIEAKQFVTEMLLGKEVRARFETRDKNGEMVSRLYVGDPGKDVGLELVKNGLAQRQKGADTQSGYKYGELTKAENEAREAKRGLWATAQPK
jgi:endonuclease YncB( thermonuclease family)